MIKSTKDVESYLAQQPKEILPMLKKMRELIKVTAPKAEEGISYGMPLYKQNGMLVGFAAAKNHLGFYPGGIVAQFKDELKGYKTSKGAIQLPYDKPLPVTLLKKIIKAKLKENKERQKERELKKTAKKKLTQ